MFRKQLSYLGDSMLKNWENHDIFLDINQKNKKKFFQYFSNKMFFNNMLVILHHLKNYDFFFILEVLEN